MAFTIHHLEDATAFVAKLLQRSPIKRYTAQETSHLSHGSTEGFSLFFAFWCWILLRYQHHRPWIVGRMLVDYLMKLPLGEPRSRPQDTADGIFVKDPFLLDGWKVTLLRWTKLLLQLRKFVSGAWMPLCCLAVGRVFQVEVFDKSAKNYCEFCVAITMSRINIL